MFWSYFKIVTCLDDKEIKTILNLVNLVETMMSLLSNKAFWNYADIFRLHVDLLLGMGQACSWEGCTRGCAPKKNPSPEIQYHCLNAF